MQERVLKISWFICGALIGILTVAFALGSVPQGSIITNDTVLYQNLSEIQVRRELEPNFDTDLSRLAHIEDRYQEKLPSLKDHPRLREPLKRVSKQKYRYAGKKR
ncbi:MAG: hypothetical protein HY843_01655 [Bdellovibrio sp.]|nr:hypothetical protein [Bdellovibrio sp.]